jgi:hypothetical protein
MILEVFMNPSCLAHLHALFECLGAPSVSIAAGTNHIALSCIPTQLPAPAELPGLFVRFLDPCFSPECSLSAGQVFWAGPDGAGRFGPCTAEQPEWTPSKHTPGPFPKLFSLILEVKLAPGPWIYALGASRLFWNGHELECGLSFETNGIRGQIIHDETVECLSVAMPGRLIETRQAAHLVIWLTETHELPEPPVFLKALAGQMRARFLKTGGDFTPKELRDLVDMENLKQVVRHPQDLAALLGLGLQLAPNDDRSSGDWDVARYLVEPVVLPGFGPAACLESGLPVAPEEFAPGWARRAVPEIRETLPARLAHLSDTLAVFLADNIQAGGNALPYLVLEPGSQMNADRQAFISQRPLLLLAREGRGARALVGSLLERERLLHLLVSRSGRQAELERERVILDRLRGTMDPLLAAVWVLGQAANLGRGDRSSLGRLKAQAQAVSLATQAEIKAVRERKPDPTADQALVNALQALADRRQKLLARLNKGNTG